MKKIRNKYKTWFLLLVIFLAWNVVCGIGLKAEASGVKTIYVFSDGSCGTGEPYRENAKLVAAVRTKGSTAEQVKEEIRYENGTVILKNMNQKGLVIYAGKLSIDGTNTVEELKLCCKTRIVQMSIGSKLDYKNKRSGKAVALGEGMADYKGAYYCTAQKISVKVDEKETTRIQSVYSENQKITLEAALAVNVAPLKYTSSNDEVAAVSPSGVIQIKKAGTAKITVSAAAVGPYPAAAAYVDLTIAKAGQLIDGYEKPNSSYVYKKGMRISIGGKVNKVKNPTFTSSDEKVIEINTNGAATVKGAGKAVITLSAPENEVYTAAVPISFTITIAKADQVISKNYPEEYKKSYGDKAFSIASGLTGEGTITYKSSNEKVAKVDKKGMVTIVGIGEAKITIAAAATANCNVAKSKHTTIRVVKKDQIIKYNSRVRKYKSSAKFSIASLTQGTKLYFESKNTKVAKVDSKGNVTIVDYGAAEIAVWANGNTYYNSISIKITVEVIPKTTAVTSASSPANDQIKVVWKKISGVAGYQIQYSLYKDFPEATPKVIKAKGDATYTTISKLASKKRYYIRVRAFMSKNGSTVKGNWSDVVLSSTVK